MAASTTQLIDHLGRLGLRRLGRRDHADCRRRFPAKRLVGGYSTAISSSSRRRKFNVSALNDATNWDALTFTRLQASANDLVGGVIYNQRLIVFGRDRPTVHEHRKRGIFPYEFGWTGGDTQTAAWRPSPRRPKSANGFSLSRQR